MSKVTDTLNACHFSVTTFNQTLLFTALPYAKLKVLGKSCHSETTLRGFILYPRTECTGDTIAIESCYHGRQGEMHHKYFIIKTGWKDTVPEVTEITDTCTDKRQLLIANGHLIIRIDDLTYTTSNVPSTEESRFCVPYDDLCEYEAGIIDAGELQKIAQEIKDGQKREEAMTIKSLQEEIDNLRNELSETSSSLQESRNSLQDKTGKLKSLQKEKGDLKERFDKLSEEKTASDTENSVLRDTNAQLRRDLGILLVDSSDLLKASLEKCGKSWIFWNHAPTVTAQGILKSTLTGYTGYTDNDFRQNFPNIGVITTQGDLTLFSEKQQ